MLVSDNSTMWPMLLDMTRDDCRRTLRRLELEAYSSMITVFRAQGALLDDRKKLLEDLRGALNISNDRHTAEARRVSNDELLSTIAEQLSGPNTGLGWVCEGRRKIPILPRSIPQTMYTELADQAASIASKENEKNAQKRMADEISDKLLAHKNSEGLEGGVQDMEVDETCSPSQDKPDVPNLPIVMYDNSDQLASEDAPPRKKSRQNAPMSPSTTPSAACTPQSKPNHQRYLNISQIYSNYSKTPTTGKVKQAERNYNQSSRGHAKTPHGPKSMVKRNAHGKHTGRNSGQVAIPHHQVRSGIKSPTDPHMPGAQAMNIQTPVDGHHLKSQTSGFQANFAQSIAKKMNLDEPFEMKHNAVQNEAMMDSPTMQLLTQSIQETTVAMQHEAESISLGSIVSPSGITMDHPAPPIKSHSTPMTGRPCQFIIKKNKLESSSESNISASSKIQVTNVQVIPPKSEISGVKVLQSRHVVMASPNNSIPKVVNSGGKIVTAKFVQQLPPKTPTHLNPNIAKTMSPTLGTEKVIIVSKPVSPTVQTNLLQRTLNRPKNIIISNQGTPLKEGDVNKPGEVDTQIKTVLQTPDTKIQPKTFLVNPKSGQKMVVLPAKARSKGSLLSQTVPLMQMKGLPGKQTPVKLVPLGSQANDTKANNITIVSKANSNILTKVISKESLPHINSAVEGSVIKPAQLHIAPKPKGQAIIRQTGPNTKSNLIVLQKSSLPNKSPITLSKNYNDTSKIVVTSKVNTSNPQQSSVDETGDKDNNKPPGNVIVLQLTNEQSDTSYTQADQTNCSKEGDQTTTEHAIITEDTPVLLHSQITEQVTHPDSLVSTSEALIDAMNIANTTKPNSCDNTQQAVEEKPLATDEKQEISSSVPEWETSTSISSKVQNEKMNLEIEMSSESDMEGYVDSLLDANKKTKVESNDNNNMQDNFTDECNDVLREHHSSISNVSRTLLSQLQDEGSSSNDSSFLFKSLAKTQIPLQSDIHKQIAANSESKVSGKQCQLNQEKSSIISEQGKHQDRQNRMDIFSTAIASANINLDSYEYLEDDMSQDELLLLTSANQAQTRESDVVRQHKDKEQASLERQLNQLMEEDHLDDSESMESSCPPSGAIE